LVYTAKDPKVYGIGFAATRDLNSYLRYDTGAENPLRGRITATVSQGNSQSGNFLRSFIHLGFNQDESTEKVGSGHAAAWVPPTGRVLETGRPGGREMSGWKFRASYRPG